MGPVVPFIPAIAGAIGGIFGGKKATASAMQRSPEEQTALTGAQGAAGNLASQGSQQFATGTGLTASGTSTLQQPTNYFSKLLSGNRALQSQAIAAPRGAIEDTYAGAERSLDRSGVRGAARDVAKADLAKNQAGAISSLITGVQPGAASALTSIGTTEQGIGANISGQGIGATGGSGNLFQNLLSQGSANRQYGNQQGQQFGGAFGKLLFGLLGGGKNSPGANVFAPSTSGGG